MIKIDYSKLLNNEQYEAMLCTHGAVLVSAGAGSGKTRLLTHRIAYLIEQKIAYPENILAITFTNKAANEMKERISKMVENSMAVTICTFHSLCARLLRRFISFLPEYTASFSIYTDADRNKVLKTVFEKLNIEDNDTKEKLDFHFSNCKNENQDIADYVKIYSYLPISKYILEGYKLYQRELIKNNAMDFDDLLVNCYALLNQNPEVLDIVQEQYRFISVDEFQDTNKVQYDLLKIIAAKYGNLLAVGDEDQSIYGWRGANVKNLLHMTKDFPDCKIFKLQENYRSTKEILKVANALIKNNSQRLDKTLYTSNENGESVSYNSLFDEQAEADFVIRRIIALRQLGVPYNSMAILMRLNALSRQFEEKLLMYNIPHKVYGGFKFYERAEVKNALAYFVAVTNPRDGQNLLRIINFPKRGIGATSIEKLQDAAFQNNMFLCEVIDRITEFDLPKSLVEKVLPLSDMLRNFKGKVDSMGLYEFADYVLKTTGVKAVYNTKEEQDLERMMNINSLLQSIKEYEDLNPELTIHDYIESITLITDMDSDFDSDSVTIATVHSAKGLEFDAVFIVGVEEKCFPIQRGGFTDNIEEERRLMYVAITRAKKALYITNSKSRFLYGRREYTIASRFLREMDLIKEQQIKNSYNASNFGSFGSSAYANTKKTDESQAVRLNKNEAVVGLKIYHPHFGKGEIIDIESLATNSAVGIKFENFGVKILSLDYAPITKL